MSSTTSTGLTWIDIGEWVTTTAVVFPPAESKNTVKCRKWREKNRDKYNEYMRKYMRERHRKNKSGDPGPSPEARYITSGSLR